MLLLGQMGVRDAELFQKQNGQWISLGHVGYKHPFKDRLYAHCHHVFPINVEKSSTTEFMLSVDESHAYKTIALALLRPHTLKLQENKFYMVFGLMIGVLILFGLLKNLMSLIVVLLVR